MTAIVFIGSRGSGKSTLGQWLAGELGVPFIEGDTRVLEHLGVHSVAQALETVGEVGWREAQLHVIPPLLENTAVISLGEDAPLISEIKHALGAIDVVFNLHTNEEVLCKRLESDVRRVALGTPNGQFRLARLPHYAILGTCGVDTSGDIEISESTIRNFLEHGHQIPEVGPRPIF